MRNIILIVLLFLLNGCLLQKRISREEAIEKAEEFVIEQGFTHKRINLDSTKTILDINEYILTKEQITEFRHNSLTAEAIYASKYGLGKWLIGFGSPNYEGTYPQDTIRRSVRAVIVSRNGKKIHREHQGYLVKKSELLKK